MRPQSGQYCPFGPKEDFFENFTLVIFNVLLVPYNDAKTGKNIHRADPERTWIIWGYNRVRIAHLSQRIFGGKLHLTDFYLIIFPFHSAKFEKNPWSGS